MNTQERIEADVKSLIGELNLQLIMARARILDLESQQEAAAEVSKPNGKVQRDGRKDQNPDPVAA